MISSFIIYIIRKKEVGKQIIIENYFSIIITWILLVILGGVEIWISNYILEICLTLLIIIINIKKIHYLFSITNIKSIIKSLKM